MQLQLMEQVLMFLVMRQAQKQWNVDNFIDEREQVAWGDVASPKLQRNHQERDVGGMMQ